MADYQGQVLIELVRSADRRRNFTCIQNSSMSSPAIRNVDVKGEMTEAIEADNEGQTNRGYMMPMWLIKKKWHDHVIPAERWLAPLTSPATRSADIAGEISLILEGYNEGQTSKGHLMTMWQIEERWRNHLAKLEGKLILGNKEIFYDGELGLTTFNVVKVLAIKGPRQWPLENAWRRSALPEE